MLNLKSRQANSNNFKFAMLNGLRVIQTKQFICTCTDMGTKCRVINVASMFRETFYTKP